MTSSSILKSNAGSVFSVRITCLMLSRLTVIERSPRNSRMPIRSFGKLFLECLRDGIVDFLLLFEKSHQRARRRFQSGDGRVGFRSSQRGLPGMPFVGETRVRRDLFLKLDDGVEHGFGNRRASGNVHIHGNDFVDALHHVIGAIESAACRACAHRDHPFGFGHLIVDLLENRRHLVVDGAEHHQDVGLFGRESNDFGSEPRNVVVRRTPSP